MHCFDTIPACNTRWQNDRHNSRRKDARSFWTDTEIRDGIYSIKNVEIKSSIYISKWKIAFSYSLMHILADVRAEAREPRPYPVHSRSPSFSLSRSSPPLPSLISPSPPMLSLSPFPRPLSSLSFSLPLPLDQLSGGALWAPSERSGTELQPTLHFLPFWLLQTHLLITDLVIPHVHNY